MIPQPPRSTLFPYTPLFRSRERGVDLGVRERHVLADREGLAGVDQGHEPVLEEGPLLGARHAREGLETRSEEHTSELQSRQYLVCRLLLEKKKSKIHTSRLR